jgi:hypothetical protein
VTNQQLYLANGIPLIINLTFNGLMFLVLNTRISQFESSINKRFDDMRDLWRAELHRVEEVLDARLKHLEER